MTVHLGISHFDLISFFKIDVRTNDLISRYNVYSQKSLKNHPLRCSTNNNQYLYFCRLPSKPQMNPENHVLSLAALWHLQRAVTSKGELSAMLNLIECSTRPWSRKMQPNRGCFMYLLKIVFKFDNLVF